MWILVRTASVYTALMMVVGCGKDPQPLELPSRSTVQIISGLVVDDLGVPVGGASARISGIRNGLMTPPVATIAGCSGYLFVVDSVRMSTASGRFVGRVTFGPATPALCVGIDVTPPSGSGLLSTSVSVLEVEPSKSTAAPETTYVTVRLGRN